MIRLHALSTRSSRGRGKRGSPTRASARAVAGTTALLLGVGLPGFGVSPAAAAGPVSAGLTITAADLEFILKQIQISEAHATTEGGTPGTVSPPNSVLSATGSNGSANAPRLVHPTLPYGLRTVDGRGNNLTVLSDADQKRVPSSPALARDLGAADRPFPKMVPFANITWKDTEPGTVPLGPGMTYVNGGAAATYRAQGGSVQDSTPRVISNLVSDQSDCNPAALQAAGRVVEPTCPSTTSNVISNQVPNNPLAAPFNSMFTLFGQFFDHGLDLVGKSGTEAVVVPLQPDDPLFVPGSRTNFIIASRTIVNADRNAINTTTPWVDQNQTYASTASKQVFLREYTLDGAGKPNSNGRMLDGPGGNIGTWAELKEQAATLLGIQLVDTDVLSVPLLLTDEYGRFLRGANGFPQMVMSDGTVVEGNPAQPITTAGAVKTGHAFLDDIAHAAVPDANYDAALLGQHFITGDGRGNENIGLTAIHTMFHSEHNRLRDEIFAMVEQDNGALEAGFKAPGWGYQERLFQAARFVNEMEYQHVVFEEFARKLSPAIAPFAAYNPQLDPDIPAEFAHAVYRFGHSMLTERIDRIDVNGNDVGIDLIQAFLNPAAFNAGAPTAAEAAGDIVRGMSKQTGSEIDEFVTGALRNNLLGLPLDLATLNMVRARDTGTATLNEARAEFQLTPYANWADLGANLRHQGTLVNLIAAYGRHPDITGATSVADKRAAAEALIALAQTSPPDPTDVVAYPLGRDDPAYIADLAAWQDAVDLLTTNTARGSGVDDVDLWVGGLAESNDPIGGAGNLLGPTFDHVFRTTLENLQEGDRFYYLDRLAGLSLLTEIEGNTISEMFIRNTDAVDLPADLFAVPGMTIRMREGQAPLVNPTLDGLTDGSSYTGTSTTGTYTGPRNILFIGTPVNDSMRGGAGDDTLRGNVGNDSVNGGPGNDVTYGGDGNDLLSDIGGADLLSGGPGHDVINGAGPGADVVNGGTGDDFVDAGDLGATFLGGGGDDLYLGGAGGDGPAGDQGDDWLEGGVGADALSGDSGAPFGLDINTPGDDVLIGGSSGDALDGGGGLDIGLDADNLAVVDEFLGGLGFDWYSYDGTAGDVNSDLGNFAPANPPGTIPAAFQDSFIDVEALSGGAGNDTLTGDDRGSLDTGFPGATDALLAGDVAKVAGLSSLLGSAGTWDSGNILMGGAGDDTIEGGGGNDLIDGDATLQVALGTPGGEVAGLGAIRGQLLDFAANRAPLASLVDIVRRIEPGSGGNDVAVFTQEISKYTVTESGGIVTVVHRIEPGAAVNDGIDTLRGIEGLRFANGEFTVAQAAAATVSAPATTPSPGPVVLNPGAPAPVSPAAPPVEKAPTSVVVSGFATKKARSAQVLSAGVSQSITLKISKVVAKKTYVTKIRLAGKWVTFGKVTSTKRGRATLHAFLVAEPGTYLIKLDPAKGRNYYAKVQIS